MQLKNKLLAALSHIISRSIQLKRGFATVSETALSQKSGNQTVQLTQNTPAFLIFEERTYGARSVIPPSALPPGMKTDRVAVVRDAFANSQDKSLTLSNIVAPLGGQGVALSSEYSQPHRRLVVDEYCRNSDGSFRLHNVASDFSRLLKREGFRVAHVPDVQQAQHAMLNSGRAVASRGPKQSTNEVLMVSPTAFGFNDQAAQDNSFMHNSVGTPANPGQPTSAVTDTVLREFSGLYRELTEVAGIKVNLFEHSQEHGTPDAVFPNNWFSTHPAGEAGGGTTESTLVLYPMKCPNRAMERRLDMQGVLRSKGYKRVIDLSAAERQGQHFEGTGVLVLDRINGVAYVALSERADQEIARHWVEKLGYKELVTFHSSDPLGKPVYHTNVLMAVGTDVAVACLDSVADAKERQHLLSRLSLHHQVVAISQEQMAALCGNVLELEDGRGLPVLAMSSRAYHAFTPDQRKILRRYVAELHHAPIDTLEHIGGGGVRCALAEIF